MKRFLESTTMMILFSMMIQCNAQNTNKYQAIEPTDSSDAPPKRLRVMPLGDSYTEGSSVDGSSYGGYRHKLYDLLTAHGALFDFVGSQTGGDFPDPEHEGHCGWVCDYSICKKFSDWAVDNWGLMQHIYEWQTNYQPDVVLFFVGINDLWSGFNVSPYDCANAQSALIDILIQYNPDIQIFVGRHRKNGGDKNIQLNQYLTEMVQAKQKDGKAVFLVDVFKNFDDSVDLGSDYHPLRTGYDIMAENWYRAIKHLF